MLTVGEKREVAHGTDHFKAGADVAHAGDDGSEGGAEGEIVETHHQCGAEDEEHIDDEEGLDGVKGPFGHRLAVQLDHRDGPRVDDGADLPPDGLEQERGSGHT